MSIPQLFNALKSQIVKCEIFPGHFKWQVELVTHVWNVGFTVGLYEDGMADVLLLI